MGYDFNLIRYATAGMRRRMDAVRFLIAAILLFSSSAAGANVYYYESRDAAYSAWLASPYEYGGGPIYGYDEHLGDSNLGCSYANSRHYRKGTYMDDRIDRFYYCEGGYASCPSGQTREYPSGQCILPPKSNGSSGCGVDFGNPINGGTGNKWQHETDLPSSASSLAFDRYYNASTTGDLSDLGSGWRHVYRRSVETSPVIGWATVSRQDGKAYIFNQSPGFWIPPEPM
jgi:hypothetical protein